LRTNGSAATISPPQPISSQALTNGPYSPAVGQDVTIDGRTIRVIRPTDAEATGKNLPTTTQVAEALRAIPSNQRAHTSTVILSPRAHGDSTPSRTIAGQADLAQSSCFP